MSYQKDLIERQAEALSTAWLKLQRAVEGDRFATAEESEAHLTDPMSWWTHSEAEKIRAVAWADVRALVRPNAKLKVRAFLKAIVPMLIATSEAEAAEDAAGWPTIGKPIPWLTYHPVQRVLAQLRLSEDLLLDTLLIWAQLADHQRWDGGAMYRDMITILTEGN